MVHTSPIGEYIADAPSKGKIVETAKLLNVNVVILCEFEQEFVAGFSLPSRICLEGVVSIHSSDVKETW